MKTIKILFICMFAAIFVNAQNGTTSDEAVTSTPEFTAVNQNSKLSLNQFFAKHYVHPKSSSVTEGTSVIQFVVNTTGTLSNFAIVNSLSNEIDDEVIRVLKETNNMWVPAYDDGFPLAMEKEIAIIISDGQTDPENIEEHFNRIAEQQFKKASKQLLNKKNAKKAARSFEMASRYKPYDVGTLTLLAICELEMGDTESAQFYADRIEKLGGIEVFDSELITQHTNKLEYYNELLNLLATNK